MTVNEERTTFITRSLKDEGLPDTLDNRHAMGKRFDSDDDLRAARVPGLPYDKAHQIIEGRTPQNIRDVQRRSPIGDLPHPEGNRLKAAMAAAERDPDVPDPSTLESGTVFPSDDHRLKEAVEWTDRVLDSLGDIKPLGTHPTHSDLGRVLLLAFEQSATGKGAIRHGNGKPFTRQPIMEIGRMVGMPYQTGQVMKKAQEATAMAARGATGPARNEMLGVIVYAAAAYLLIEEMETPS